MPRSTKPRKPYRHRPAAVNSLAMAIENSATMDPALVAQTCAALMQSTDLFARGDEPQHRWSVMSDASNVAEQLANIGICSDPESRAAIQAGQDALAAVAIRQQRTGSWTLQSCELAALRAMLERHAIQLRLASRGEYERAIERARRLTVAARAGSHAPNVTVIGALH